MSIASKFLPAIALAAALSPLAAHAQSAPRLGSAQVYMAPPHHQATQANIRADEVAVGSATIDSPAPIYSNQAFPGSFGG
jgi:hypothetical protein